MAQIDVLQSGFSRVWITENGSSPKNNPEYQGCLRIVDPSRNFGDVESVYKPSDRRYNEFVEVGEIAGVEERATFSIEGYYPKQLSSLLRIAKLKCPVDIQVHIGTCEDPRVYDDWEKIITFSNARITSHSISDIGALTPDDRAVMQESADVSSRDYYEIVRLSFQQFQDAALDGIGPLTDIAIYGTEECVECSGDLRGCDTAFAVSNTGVVAFTSDGGATFGTTTVPGLTGPARVVVAGAWVIVAPIGGSEVYYANAEDIVSGTETWSTISGFAGPISDMVGDSLSAIWVSDSLGNVYKLSQLRIAYQSQISPAAITSLSVWNDCCVLAASGASVFSTGNEGETWAEATAPGTALSAVHVPVASAAGGIGGCNTWIVNTNTGTYCTGNNGLSWQPVPLPVNVQQINNFAAATGQVMFAAGTLSTGAATLLRTTNAGNSWTVLPDPPFKQLPGAALSGLRVAVCEGNPNSVHVVGADGAEGVWIKGSPR